ncbi:hypothetical protein FACS1894211_10730 [Clostridia bacterium]|nr:hypothetical protein FACS1894211_10730 [Clostridia bacterium]
MKCKRIFVCLIGVCMMLITTACKNPDDGNKPVKPPPEESEYTSLFSDKTFKKGFTVRGLGNTIYDDPVETFGNNKTDPTGRGTRFQYGADGLENESLGKPEWNLAQWATRYPIHDWSNAHYDARKNDSFNSRPTENPFDYRYTVLSAEQYLYENRSKFLMVDTKTGEYTLDLKTSECYKTPRKDGEEWPHWIIEKHFGRDGTPPVETKVSASKSLRVKMDVRLDAFKSNYADYPTDAERNAENPVRHSAMSVFYLYISNYEPRTGSFTDMLWFGLPVFDNRYTFTTAQSFPDVGSKGSATEKWIYNIATTEFFDLNNNLYDADGKMILDQWKSIDVELIPHIKMALAEAQRNGYMKNAKWENLYVNGMYNGFEVPGSYDIRMSYKNMDVLSAVDDELNED